MAKLQKFSNLIPGQKKETVEGNPGSGGTAGKDSELRRKSSDGLVLYPQFYPQFHPPSNYRSFPVPSASVYLLAFFRYIDLSILASFFSPAAGSKRRRESEKETDSEDEVQQDVRTKHKRPTTKWTKKRKERRGKERRQEDDA